MRQRLDAKAVDGYCPIAGYLGNEGWNTGLELRADAHHLLQRRPC